MSLYTSSLLEVSDNTLEITISKIESSDRLVLVKVTKYSSSNDLISSIIPKVWYVENGMPDSTTIRVYFEDNQVQTGEKVQVRLESEM